MPIEISEPYADLTFMSPLSDRRAERLVQFVVGGEPDVVLDLGCGWAELLLRVVSAAPNCRGIGVDSDESAIRHGQQLRASRGVDDRLTLIAGDAKTAAPSTADAVLCVGASQIWGNGPDEDGSFTEPLDYRRALTALRDLVPRAGRLVYGEGIWSIAPTAAAVEPLAGRLDEFVTLAELVDVAVGCGFAPMAVHEADLDEWDSFEFGFTAPLTRWLASHDREHPDFGEVQSRADRQRTGYLRGYRGVLGMAYLELVAV